MWLKFFARLGYRLGEFSEYVLASGLCLHERLFKYLETKSVALDVHLCGCQSVFRTGSLEVHVTEVVLIAENIAEHGILVFARVLDETHRDAAHRFLHRHSGIHQRERAGTYGSHRRRAVALEDLAHQTHSVGEVLGYLALKTAPCKMSVSYLTTSHTALRLCLAGAERREVVVQQETLIALVEHIVHQFLVEFSSKRTCGETLCLAAGEYRASVRHWQRAYLTPYRAYLVCLAAVETYSLVEDAAAHGIALHVVIVTVHHGALLFQFVLGEVCVRSGIAFLELFDDLLERFGARMLVEGLACDIVCFLIALLAHLLAQLLVVHLVVILALHILAKFFRQFGL